MAERSARNAGQESFCVGARGQSTGGPSIAAEGVALLPRTAAIVSSARDVQIVGSTLSVVGRDVHNHYYQREAQKSVWAILQLIPNFRTIYLDMLSKATSGTGQWLLRGNKFGIWLEPNGNIKIFWGSGIPGAGKTLLASIVIEHLEALSQESDGNICVCFVFFRYSDRSEVTVRNVLEVLVKQTLERHPDCLAVVEQAYARHLREGTEPNEAELLELLRDLNDRMKCTFYVLDALDEAPTKIQLAVLRALASLNVKLFVTSRPLKTVEASFPHAHTFTIVAQDADLDLHITQGISDNAELQRLVQVDPMLRDEIFSTIKQNCGGMFLHASLQLDALSECASAHAVRRTLSAFPSRIEDAYLQTWDRILKQAADNASLAKLALVWLLNASRSMTVEELEQAVATSPETHKIEASRVVPVTTLVSLCRGLIVVEEESRLVRLVHYTAKDILEGLLRQSFPHPHSLLAAICMTHLAEAGFQNTTIRSGEWLSRAFEEEPLLAYASEAWGFHARAGLDMEETKLRAAEFIMQSKAFPAFTDLHRTSRFDVITPLHLVGLYRLPLVLIEGCVIGNPNVISQIRQQSPLTIASQFGHEEFVAYLLTCSDIEVNWSDTSGSSALMQAAEAAQDGVVKILLTHPKIQVNLRTRYGWPALVIAARYGHGDVVRSLLAHPEIMVNLVNGWGHSALILAARFGHAGVVKLLLNTGACEVNASDINGETAIKMAAQRRHETVVRLLLGISSIDITVRSADGHTAMSAAQANDHHGIVELLQDFETRRAATQEDYLDDADEDGSESESSECYFDAEEPLGAEGVVSLA